MFSFHHETRLKRSASNAFGLVVLCVIAMMIGLRAATNYADVVKTKRDLDTLAQQVASNNRKVLMSWARGEWKDSWQNTFAIEHNGDKIGRAHV